MKWARMLLVAVLAAACSGDANVYREYECSFVFDTSLHPQPCQLTGILGNPGHFVKIETGVEQGIRHIRTTRNYDNSTEDIRITTERETQLRYALGAGNCIIVGTVSYENRLVAYEGQCPNCLSDLGGTRYPMTWQQSGTQLHCAKCGRSYDVNNGVVVSGSSGRQLFTYMVAFDGQLLRAWN